MARDPLQKKIKSDLGAEHVYTFFPLPAGRGVKLFRRLLKHVPQALTDGLAGLEGAADADPTANDLAGLGDALARVAELIGDSGDDEFFKALLFETVRQDPESGKGCKVADNFDSVYQCNYGELFQATVEVLRLNFGPAIKAIMGNLNRGALLNSRPPTEK